MADTKCVHVTLGDCGKAEARSGGPSGRPATKAPTPQFANWAPFRSRTWGEIHIPMMLKPIVCLRKNNVSEYQDSITRKPYKHCSSLILFIANAGNSCKPYQKALGFSLSRNSFPSHWESLHFLGENMESAQHEDHIANHYELCRFLILFIAKSGTDATPY